MTSWEAHLKITFSNSNNVQKKTKYSTTNKNIKEKHITPQKIPNLFNEEGD